MTDETARHHLRLASYVGTLLQLIAAPLATSACTADTDAIAITVPVEDEPASCDDDLALEAQDAANAARALGLCQAGDDERPGLLDARYVQVDGSILLQSIGHGILTHFGSQVVPREGATLLALSSGSARNVDDEFWRSPFGDVAGPRSGPAPGFPRWPPACADSPPVLPPLDTTAYDPIALDLELRVPESARSFSFDFDFYTSDFPIRTCHDSNDVFAVVVTPAPPGSLDGNVAFDAAGNHVGVNSELLRVCEPQATGQGVPVACALGPSELEGTGYADPVEAGPHAATGWMTTRVPVTGGSVIHVLFAIWDSADFDHDSLVLLDRFAWSATALEAPTTAVAGRRPP